MKFYIYTLGCKVNEYESRVMADLLTNQGFIESENDENVDVCIINTCSVTNTADHKSAKVIRSAIRKNPAAIVVVTGCFAQASQDNALQIEGVDIVIGNKNKTKIVDYINEFYQKKEQLALVEDMTHISFEPMRLNNFNKTRAFVKIQDGCNNFCSYCIIPFMRGNIRSKELDTAIMEINCLVKNGYKEIVLTGIHTGSYGDSKNYDLTDLIHEISKNENLKRIRISSIEITELNAKFMEELKNNKKIVSHFHVPLQSGSDHVLKLMNRKYNILEYKKKIEELRSIREDINITTDLIVGFPEETDEDFIETLKNIKDIGFSKIHTFPFSLRSGTKAETLKQVSDTKKRERVLQVLKLSDELESLYYKKFLGKEVEVLVEDSKSGFTGNYIKVHLDKEMNTNTFVNVMITSVDGLCVNGKVL